MKPKPTAGFIGFGAGTREPANWKWEKQELEKQVKDLKKKCDDLQVEAKKPAFQKVSSAYIT